MPDHTSSTARARTATPAGAAVRHVLLLAMEWTPAVSGGVGTYVYELARGLAASGCRVTLLSYADGNAEVVEQGAITVHRVRPSAQSLARSARVSLVQGVLAFNEDLLRYAANLFDDRPDLVHFHQWHTRPAALELAARLRVPVIGTSHHLSEPAERWWGQTPDPEIVEQERALFNGETEVITVSHSMKREVCKSYPIAAERVHVIHCGMDPAPFRDKRPAPAALSLLRGKVANPEDVVILYTGRIHPQKGIAAIFEAAAQVVERSPRPVRYLLAGGTDSRASSAMIEALEAQYPALAPHVRRLGKLPRPQLTLLHRVADFAVVPSVYEPFGFTALETMASGTPVIVSDDGGLAEIVIHGESGLKVGLRARADGQRSVDVDAFASAQLQLIRDPVARARYAAAGQQRAADVFSLDAMIRRNLDVYAGLLGTRVVARHESLEPAALGAAG